MNVRELIALLADCEPETEVVVRAYEGGVNTVISIQSGRVKRFYSPEESWWQGQHDDAPYGIPEADLSDVIHIIGGRIPVTA
jgi:hypothetical protein